MILGGLVKFKLDESKPRASGDDPTRRRICCAVVRVNPARAGMILLWTGIQAVWNGKPRASGDDPWSSPASPALSL